MMKFQYIRTKIILAIAVGLGLALAAILLVLDASWNRSLDQLGRNTLTAAREGLANLETSDARMLAATLDGLGADDRLREAYRSRDYEGLRARVAPIFQRLNERHGITQLNWIDANGTLFARAQSPTRGDVIKRSVFSTAIRTQKTASGKDLGKTGFSLRVVAPYLSEEGKVLGYNEIGEEIGHFLAKLKAQTGADYRLVVRKSSLDRGDYAATRAKLGQPDNWDAEEAVVVVSSTGVTAAPVGVGDVERVAQAGEPRGIRREAGRATFDGVLPVLDAAGERVGLISMTQDITGTYDEMVSTRYKVVGVISALMVALGLSLLLITQRLVFRRLDMVISKATRVVGGDYESAINVAVPDEVGKLEKLIDQFREVFVSTVNDLSSALAAQKPKTGA